MLRKFLFTLTTLVTILGLLVFATPAAAASFRRQVTGTIIAMNSGAKTITVKPNTGAIVVIKTNARTAIKNGGARSNYGALHVGSKATVTYNVSTKVASSVSATWNVYLLSGNVASVDTTASTVTITPLAGGDNVVLNVDLTTLILRDCMPVTLADLVVGDRVDAVFDSGTMLASFIVVETEFALLRGAVSTVDTVAGTLTITLETGGGSVMVNVMASTFILGNSAILTLPDLQIGKMVNVVYELATMDAVFIFAEQ